MNDCNCTGITDGVHATWCPLSRTETITVTANTVIVDEKRLILLSEVQRLTGENIALERENERLNHQRTILLQGLEFYARQADYSPSWHVTDCSHVMEDGGNVARNALRVVEP